MSHNNEEENLGMKPAAVNLYSELDGGASEQQKVLGNSNAMDTEEQPEFEEEEQDMKPPAVTPKLKDPPPQSSTPNTMLPRVDEEMGPGEENDDAAGDVEEKTNGANAASPKDEDEAFDDEHGDADEAGKKKPKREINPLYKDVKETGKWGDLSKAEMIGVGIVLVLIIVGVVVAVLYFTVFKDDDTNVETELIPQETSPPTPAPTPIPPEEKLASITAALGSFTPTTGLLDGLSDDTVFYVDKGPTEDGACLSEPHVCAMYWALYEDDFAPAQDDLVNRFALASIYYSMGGHEWLNSSNWLADSSYCEWYGIECERVGTAVEELDLSSNNLKGEIPEELILLQSIEVISFKENQVSGILDGDLFASLGGLYVLYVQDNNLTGPIPSNLRDNGSLCKYHFRFSTATTTVSFPYDFI